MNWRKTTATAVLAVVVVFCMIGCPTKPPATPGAPWGPDSTWRGGVYVCSVATTVSKGNIRYVMSWTDATDTGDVAYGSGETAAVTHTWSDTGHFDVKAKAILDADPTKASDFSQAKSVKVLPNSPPVVDSVQRPPVGVVGTETPFVVFGSDPDGDSLRVVVNWGSGKDTTTSYSLSPCNISMSHVFTKVETAKVVVQTQDWKGAKSTKPDTIRLPVGTSGGVKFTPWQSTDGDPISSSVVVANDGTDEVVMGSCEGAGQFYSIKTNGNTKRSASPKDAAGGELFTGNPGLMNNGHIIVGSDEGELYALTINGLNKAWQWPDSAVGHPSAYNWGAPAFNGADIYIAREDETLSLYHFVDAGSSVSMAAVYMLKAQVVDAPVVDAGGNVIVCTDDSGYLIKFDQNLTSPIWRTRLLSGPGEANGVIIGTDGTIYCGSDAPLLYAIDPDSGHVKWTTPLDASGTRPVIGRDTLFVGSDNGTFYSINPTTGSINWQKTLSQGGGFETAPIVADNGYVYVQDVNDVLYCLNQADGTTIWSCDCPSYLGSRSGSSHRPRTRKLGVAGLNDYSPNPSITSKGDIIVVGADALYFVAGYTDGPLDSSAAWPKWQKNLSNTGSETGK